MNEQTLDDRYVGSRIYLHHPPGQTNVTATPGDPPKEAKDGEKENDEADEEPKMNQWSCLVVFLIAVPLTAVTAEWVRVWCLLSSCRPAPRLVLISRIP